ELLPYEHPPQRRHQSGALTKTIRNGSPCLSRRDQIQRISDAPDDATKNTNKVRRKAATKIFLETRRCSTDRPLEKDGVENKIADENTKRENDHRCIRGHLPHRRIDKVVQIHRSRHTPI